MEVSTNAVMDTSLKARRRHKSWPEALKREIVAASFAPGASVSVVARQYDVNTNQVFGWRKRFANEPTALPVAQLVPVMVTPDRADTPPPLPAADIIEIELPSGHRVRIGSGVKAGCLRLVLNALERTRAGGLAGLVGKGRECRHEPHEPAAGESCDCGRSAGPSTARGTMAPS